MKVLESVKKGRAYIVKFSDGNSARLFPEIVEKYALYSDVEFDDKLLSQILSNNEYKRTNESAMRILARRNHSIFELRTKLIQRGFENNHIDNVISGLVNLGYLDDKKFAESFYTYASEYRKYGPNKIMAELYKRGVSRELSESALNFKDVIHFENALGRRK